jgi:hypothetical protein
MNDGEELTAEQQDYLSAAFAEIGHTTGRRLTVGEKLTHTLPLLREMNRSKRNA